MGKSKNIKILFKKVKLVALDVDGVLTKGEIIYDYRGQDYKVFNVKDGLGIFLLNQLGVRSIILTAKGSPALNRRAKDMRVEEVIGGILPKEKALGYIKQKYKVKEEDICFIGDDLIDLELIKRVGVGVAVADAAAPLKKSAKYITRLNGGEGAVREVVDLIIKAKRLEKRLYKFLKTFTA